MSVPKSVVNTAETVGVVGNLITGHAGEMAGRAMEAAGKASGCPVAQTAGKAVAAAGEAWASKAVEVGRRDGARLRGEA